MDSVIDNTFLKDYKSYKSYKSYNSKDYFYNHIKDQNTQTIESNISNIDEQIKQLINLFQKGTIECEVLCNSINKLNEKNKNKCWDECYITILKILCEKCAIYRWMHSEAGHVNRKHNNYMFILAGLSSLGLGMLTLISSALDWEEKKIIFISGIGHLWGTTLTGVSNFLQLQEKMEGHELACIQFDQLYRKINTQGRDIRNHYCIHKFRDFL